MIQFYQLNISERYASQFFRADEGQRMETSRTVKLDLGDPRVAEIAAFEERLWSEELDVACSWRVVRAFEPDELDAAPLLHIEPRDELRTTAEQARTRYDESTACPVCGSGATLIPPVRMDIGKLPSSMTIARTFGGEWLIAEPLRAALETFGATGAQFEPVSSPRKGRAGTGKQWYLLRVTSPRLEIVPPTRYGSHAVLVTDDPNECPRGDKLGLIQLTPLHVRLPGSGSADFHEAAQFVGMSGEMLRSKRPLFVSQRVRQLLADRGNDDLVMEVPQIVE